MQKFKNVSISLSRVVIICLIVAVFTAGIVYSTTPIQPFTINRGVYPGAPSFTVWGEGGNYFAKNEYGVLMYGGDDAATVIQEALDTPNSGGVFIKGIIDITAPIRPTGYQTIQGEGWISQLHATGDFPVIIMDGINSATVKDMSIRGGGNTNTNAHGIQLINRPTFCHLTNLWIHSCRHGIDINGCYWLIATTIQIIGSGIDQNYIGVYSHPPTVGVDTDGQFTNIMVSNTISHAFRLEHCNGMSFQQCAVTVAGGKGFYVGAPSSPCTVVCFLAANCFVDAEEEAYFLDGRGTISGDIGACGLDKIYASNSKIGLYGYNLVATTISNIYFLHFLEDAIKLEGSLGSRVQITNGYVGEYGYPTGNTYCGIRLINQNHCGVHNVNFLAVDGLDAIREEGDTCDHNIFIGNDAADGGGMTVIGENTISQHNI